MQPSKAGAILRAMRPTKIYTCKHCGKEFTATDARAKFCSARCTNTWWNAKRRVPAPSCNS